MQLALPMDDYVLGVWYLSWPGHDWLLFTMRSVAGGVYGTSMFRYPSGERSMQALQRRPEEPAYTDADAINSMRRMVAEITSRVLVSSGLTLSSDGVLLDEVIVCGDRAKMEALLRGRPWVTDDVLPVEPGSN